MKKALKLALEKFGRHLGNNLPFAALREMAEYLVSSGDFGSFKLFTVELQAHQTYCTPEFAESLLNRLEESKADYEREHRPPMIRCTLRFTQGQRVQHTKGKWTGVVVECPDVLRPSRSRNDKGEWVYMVKTDAGVTLAISEVKLKEVRNAAA